MDIEDIIEEKYTNWLNCETDDIDLTIEEAKHILVNDHKQRYVDELLEESWKIVLSELEKKEAIMNEMAEWINRIDSTIFCNKSECNDNCKECVIKEFTKKVEGK